MNIYESISKAMADVGAIGKTKWNEQQKFKFRGIDDVMNSLHPVLEKNKIFVVPEVLEQTREDRVSGKGNPLIYSICKIKFTFYAEDGSSVTAVVIGEGMDSGDKATNKAMSIAFKYALFQIFCIPTEEMQDPDAESHDLAPKGKQTKRDNAKQAPAPEQAPGAEDQKTAIIDAKSVELLRGMFQQNGIDEAFVCELYKIAGLEAATRNQYSNMMSHMDGIKKMQEEKK
jgi:hypothetical protein